MSSPGLFSVREGGRRSAFALVGGLVCGILMTGVAGALVFIPHRAATGASLFGLAAPPDNVALGLAVLGAAMIFANLAPTLRLLRAGIAGGNEPMAYVGGAPEIALEGPYRGNVAFKLIEPGANKDISLLDAVRRAHEESGPTDAGAFAEFVAKGPDDIVTMYATFFAEHVPIYGCKRPSADVERISLSNPLKEFHVEDGVLVLRERRGAVTYDGLRMKAADYPLALECLRTAS